MGLFDAVRRMGERFQADVAQDIQSARSLAERKGMSGQSDMAADMAQLMKMAESFVGGQTNVSRASLNMSMSATPDAVYASLTDPGLIQAWLAEQYGPLESFDFAVAPGSWRVVGRRGRDHVALYGQVLSVDPPHGLTLTASDEPDHPDAATVTCTVTPTGSGADLLVLVEARNTGPDSTIAKPPIWQRLQDLVRERAQSQTPPVAATEAAPPAQTQAAPVIDTQAESAVQSHARPAADIERPLPYRTDL